MFPSSDGNDLLETLRALMGAGRYREALERHGAAADDGGAGAPEAVLLAATAATRLGRVAEAWPLARQALDGFRERVDSDGRMRAHNLQGAIAFEEGQLTTAEEQFGAALRLARALGDTLLQARASNNLASVAHLRGKSDQAVALYRSALVSYQRLGDRRGLAETWHNVGIVHRFRGEWEAADAAANDAIRHAESLADDALCALTLSGRAELALDRGDIPAARRAISHAAERARAADDEVGVAEVDRLAAVLALREGDAPRALRLAEQAIRLADSSGLLLLGAEARSTAALALRMMGQDVAAEEYRDTALAAFERLGAEGFVARFDREWERR